MSARAIAGATALLALLCGPVGAQEAIPPVTPTATATGGAPASVTASAALDFVLGKVAERGRAVRDFRARFRQEKVVEILDRPILSTGRLLFRPGRLRWETETPAPSVLVIDDRGMRVWLSEVSTLEVYEFSGQDALGAILPLFGQSAEDMRRGYDVSLDPGPGAPPDVRRLRLVPRSERVRRVLAAILVDVDTTTWLPRRLAFSDANGDVTTTDLTAFETNVGLDEDAFRFEPPPGTKTKKPLGGLPF